MFIIYLPLDIWKKKDYVTQIYKYSADSIKFKFVFLCLKKWENGRNIAKERRDDWIIRTVLGIEDFLETVAAAVEAVPEGLGWTTGAEIDWCPDPWRLVFEGPFQREQIVVAVLMPTLGSRTASEENSTCLGSLKREM